MPAIVYVEEYKAKCDDSGSEIEAEMLHVVGTTPDNRKLDLNIEASAIPAPGTPERDAFLADPPVNRDVTEDMGRSCCSWQYERDL
jgi:hypothetical protein